jgi:hypothetical protein
MAEKKTWSDEVWAFCHASGAIEAFRDEETCRMEAESHGREITVARLTGATDRGLQCCQCGAVGLSSDEDGGPECQLSDDRWTCSDRCYDRAIAGGVDLSDPVAVHVNLLLGTIARPDIGQMLHLYGRDTVVDALGLQVEDAAALRAAAAPFAMAVQIARDTLPKGDRGHLDALAKLYVGWPQLAALADAYQAGGTDHG